MDRGQLDKLQNELGYEFRDTELLVAALTHSSYANENRKSGAVSNERLEFLGDSVLGMTVANMIYEFRPDMTEGQMTRLRAELVCEKSLVGIAKALKLGDCLMLGRGEVKGGGRTRPSILADAVEAILAAIYLDGGLKPAAGFISKHITPLAVSMDVVTTDHKTLLQEVVQEKAGRTLSYCTTNESGPDHQKEFTVEVSLNGTILGSGKGRSKKEAEQSAARAALEELTK
jgi:ribonuclease-3